MPADWIADAAAHPIDRRRVRLIDARYRDEQGGMTFSAEDLGCPLLPADLANRRLATKTQDLERVALWRTHRAHLDPIYYNRRAPGVIHYRFDAAGGGFGVLSCMAEAVIREGLSRTTSAVTAR